MYRFAAIGDNSASLCERDTPIPAQTDAADPTPADRQTTWQLMMNFPKQMLTYWAFMYVLTGLLIYAYLESVGIEHTVNQLVRMGLMRRETANTLRDDYNAGHKMKIIMFFNECCELMRFPLVFGSWQVVMRVLLQKGIVKI